MALVLTKNKRLFKKKGVDITRMNFYLGTMAFDSSYPTGGEDFSSLLHFTPDLVNIPPYNGYIFEYDYTNEKVKVYTHVRKQLPFTIKDDDSAATNGVAVYLHVDEVLEDGSVIGHLEFVSPTNADTVFQLGANGPKIAIRDDDAAATGGNQVYFDEDAANGDSRILATTTNNHDVFILATDGSLVKITDDDSASSNGVALYLDEDATNAYEKFLFVSPTNADGTAYTMSGEVPNGYDLSGLTAVPFEAKGF